MPGIPTHFIILEKTIDALKASPNSALNDIAAVMENNSPYAYFGAVGATIGDFIPSGPGVVSQYVKVWYNLFDIISGWGTPGHPGLLNIVNTIFGALDALDPIAQAEDQDALEALAPQLGDMATMFGAFTILQGELQTRGMRIVSRINGSGPMMPPSAPGTVPPVSNWLIRDVLHWKKTGEFCKALLNRAGTDERFQAYAYGYIISYVANAVGAPFVNSIVLGPYRTAWWRHRFVQNWIDAWVYGQKASGATMSGDDPTPPYNDPAWASLCGAKLEKNLEIAGVTYNPVDLMNKLPKGFETETSVQEAQPFPILLPPDFGNFWVQAYSDAYGVPTPDSPVKPEALNDAYCMTWLMLWFQTDSLGCNPAPKPTPPTGCDKPDWADPAIPGDAGAGKGPPVNGGAYEQTDTAESVCGWILAILGGLFGGVLGAGMVAGGVALIEDAHNVDWVKMRCDLYWYRYYVYHAVDLIHTLLLLGGLDFPRSGELAINSMTNQFAGTNFLSGAGLCKSQERQEDYPSKPWIPSIATPGNWTDPPSTWEWQLTIPYLASEYPPIFVDAPTIPLNAATSADVGGTWPPGYKIQNPKSGLPAEFANAVDNAVNLLTNLKGTLPDWNLDGDRGLAYLTWQFHNSQYTDPVAIEKES